MSFIFGDDDTTTTSKVELDPDLKKAALQNLRLTNEIAQMPMPIYEGPQVAGLQPGQVNAQMANDQAAAAFGMPSSVNWKQQSDGSFQTPKGMEYNDMFTALTGLAPPNASAGGQSGYSYTPMFQEALDAMPEQQRMALESFFMDPNTGRSAANPVVGSQSRVNYTGDKPHLKKAAVEENQKYAASLGKGPLAGQNSTPQYNWNDPTSWSGDR